MRETRTSGSEGGGAETNRFSLPLSYAEALLVWVGRSTHFGLGLWVPDSLAARGFRDDTVRGRLRLCLFI
jgi:hypothetical protein